MIAGTSSHGFAKTLNLEARIAVELLYRTISEILSNTHLTKQIKLSICFACWVGCSFTAGTPSSKFERNFTLCLGWEWWHAKGDHAISTTCRYARSQTVCAACIWVHVEFVIISETYITEIQSRESKCMHDLPAQHCMQPPVPNHVVSVKSLKEVSRHSFQIAHSARSLYMSLHHTSRLQFSQTKHRTLLVECVYIFMQVRRRTESNNRWTLHFGGTLQTCITSSGRKVIQHHIVSVLFCSWTPRGNRTLVQRCATN